MNSDIIEGNWKQLMGEAEKQWVKLTNDHLSEINGSRKKLSGIIQEQYGIMQDEAEKQIKAWEAVLKSSKAA